MVSSICYVLVGAALICLAVYGNRAARVGRSWPTVHGWIIERGLRANRTRRSGDVSYSPAVKFEYSVHGRLFTSDDLYLTLPGARFALLSVAAEQDEEDAQAFVDALPNRVAVHYEPGNPARCYVLLRTPAWAYWLMLGFGGFALVIGSAGVLSTL